MRIPAPFDDIKYDYFNRKAYYSFAMQVVIDSSAKFIDVHIGEPGFVNDSWILCIFLLYDPASHGTLLRGPSIRLPSRYRVPSILLTDSIYLALSWLIPSFKKDHDIAQLSVTKKEFNKNLSKARIYFLIAFGRMKRVFKEVGWRSRLNIDFLP